MNLKHFKKRIVKESAVFTGVLLVSLIVLYVLSSISDDYSESNGSAQSRLKKTEQELAALQKKYSFVTENSEIYNEMQKKQADGKLFISRQIMFEKFNQFRSQFDLSNVHLSVSPVQEMKNAKYKRKTSVVDFSEVNVDLGVLYDENVFELLNAMQRELSGICSVSRLSMTMSKPLDAGILQTVSAKGTFPLIKTTIKFNWYSINPVESSDAGNDAAKK